MGINDIKKIDSRIHAFISFNDNADKEKGFPVAVKDNFNTMGIQTSAASNILKGYIPPYDATVVRKLKEAGAVIVGKTNMDAFAHGSSTETSDFGPTSNPWNLDYLPGGSSGGSAAAVASGEVSVAIGSETAGSIRQPAAWCGIVGLKPTYGRVSRYGLISMASSTDSPGTLAATVADAAKIYRIIAGHDPLDASSSQQLLGRPEQVSLKNITIGIPKEYFRSESQKGINDKVMSAARVLEKLGAKIKKISLFDPKFAISVYTIVQRSEVSSNLSRFDGIRFGKTRDFFNQENKRRIMLGTYTLSAGYYDAYYKKAQQVRTIIIEDFARAFSNVNVIIGPTSPSTALKKGSSKDQPLFGELQDIFVEPSSLAGLPAINVPCGFINGLPVGMQIIGPQWSEEKLISVAQTYEENTDWHKNKPKLW